MYWYVIISLKIAYLCIIFNPFVVYISIRYFTIVRLIFASISIWVKYSLNRNRTRRLLAHQLNVLFKVTSKKSFYHCRISFVKVFHLSCQDAICVPYCLLYNVSLFLMILIWTVHYVVINHISKSVYYRITVRCVSIFLK